LPQRPPKMTRGQAMGKKKADKRKKRVKVEAYKAACVMYADAKEAGGLSAQQVCDLVGYQMCLNPGSKPKPKSVRRGALQEQTYPSAPVDTHGGLLLRGGLVWPHRRRGVSCP